jgi:hypothetical protein
MILTQFSCQDSFRQELTLRVWMCFENADLLAAFSSYILFAEEAV